MSERRAPSGAPGTDLARFLDDLRGDVDHTQAAIARGALPAPLQWRVTNVAPGPPPTFLVEILNPQSGAAIPLGII